MKKAMFAAVILMAIAQAVSAMSVGSNATDTMQKGINARMAQIDAATR